MVKDIDPGSSSGFPDWLTNVSGTLFFTAADPVFGRELWKSDGTATGTVQVKDVYPGGLSASPVELTAADGRLFFRASDGVHGHELWWSDGTSNGTIMIADIRPGSSSSLLENVLAIPDLGLGITRIFFRANDGSKGNELWSAILNPNPVVDLAVTKQDSPDPVFADEPLTYTIGVTNNGPGAATGVTLVDTLPPTITFGSVTTTQGTCSESGGTVTCDLGVMPVGAQATATIDIFTPTATGTIFNFAEVESNEIDPVPANNTTTEATDVVDPPPISDLSISKTVLHELVAVGVPIHYTLTLRNEGPAVATDVSVTDVLPAGTVATSATTPQGTCTIGTGTVTCDLGSVAKRVDLTLTVVAVASDVGLIDNFASTTAVETDPDLTNNSSTAQARVIRPPVVEMVKDIRPGNFASSRPADFADIDGILFFSADDFSTNGRELWKSDGTEEGTVFVKDIRPGGNDSSLGQITNVGGVAFFRANDGTLGAELWKSDGTATGTVLVKDIEPGISSGLPFTAYLTEFNDELFFIADDGVNGIELWKSDGTATGTFMVKDIDPSFSSVPTELTAIGDTLFFSANDGDTIGSELWKSDGTATGTVVVKNISPFDFFGSFPTNLVNVSGTLFFRANDNTSGIELWKSDGTATGTVLVKDISPGGAGSSPDDLTAAGDVLYFTADRGIEGRELWKSDGTATGTVLVKDVRPGVNSSLIGDMIGASSTVFFDADDGTNGRDLWTSDGTASGTVIVLDIAQGAGAGSFPDELSYFNPLFFTAGDGFNGEELWMSDGGDTFQLADIRSGPFGSLTSEILPVFSNTLGLYQVFFDAYNGSNGEELWKVLINPLPIADLSLTKNASPTPVLPVDALTYTVTVTNNGPGSATGVQIVDTLPASVAFDSAVATQGSCGVAGSVVTCSVGILAAGQQATATITVFTSSSLGFITNTSTVIAVEDDPVPGNNAASVVVEVVAPPAIADISVTKSLVPPTFAVVGKSIGFGFTIENDGPGFAHNLTLTDVLPSGVTYDSFGASQGTCSEVGGTVTCDLGTLIKRDTATVVIHVIPNSVGQITNTGSVSADEADPDSGNNVSTIEERVLGEDPIQPIADIVPGTGHSFPFLFTPVGSDVFFVADR